jgi:hypothetical protein
MTEQEIRAKALEIAALILGPKIETKISPVPYSTARIALDYDATLTHYIPLAEDVGRYIREGGGD